MKSLYLQFSRTCLPLLAVVAAPLLAAAAPSAQDEPRPAAVVAEVVERVLDAMYVTGDETVIRNAVHPQYTVLLAEGDALLKYTAEQLLTDIRNSKAAGRYPIFPRLKYQVEMVDVTETTASAKVRVYQDGTHTCSDLILLYRFTDGWKLVSLTTHHHAELKRS